MLDNYGGSAVRLRNFDLRGAPRFGGLVSMLEGGASVERVTAGTITQAGRAISYEEKGLSWSAPAGTSLVVDLTQDLHVIDRIRLKSTTNTSALKELELRVSTSGSADSDFTTALVATLPQDGLMHAFTFPPVSARFVQLISRSSYGSTTVTIANFQVFARDVGGRTLSFEDRSNDVDGRV
ncbi:MAG: hypothetical protein HYV07_25615, partial [Deltaproteobacteria bacterium]|nr:hypothetical protein [Deltaproteobacteria bacterium]